MKYAAIALLVSGVCFVCSGLCLGGFDTPGEVEFYCGYGMIRITYPNGAVVTSEFSGSSKFVLGEESPIHYVPIQLIAIQEKILPFPLVLDIDGDGQEERVALEEIDLSSAHIENSYGSLNLRSGSLIVSATLALASLPPATDLGLAPQRMTLVFTGVIDIEGGIFEVQGEGYIRSGPLAGTKIDIVKGCIANGRLRFTVCKKVMAARAGKGNTCTSCSIRPSDVADCECTTSTYASVHCRKVGDATLEMTITTKAGETKVFLLSIICR